MPTKHPRVNVVLEKQVYESVRDLAKQKGVSLSLEIRDLVRDALELYEDVAIEKWIAPRMKSLKKKDLLSHEEFWKKVKASRK